MSVGVSETVSSLTKMRDRRVVLLAGITAMVTWGTVRDLLLGHVELQRAAWQLGGCLTFLVVAIVLRRGTSRWPWLCPALVAMVVAVGPFSATHPDSGSSVDVPVALVPIIVGLLFFERLEIVVASVVSGFLATTAWWGLGPARGQRGDPRGRQQHLVDHLPLGGLAPPRGALPEPGPPNR